SAGGSDCQDQDTSIYPGATELPYDGVDQDCNGTDLIDVDGDGAAGGASGTDCNDNNGQIKPGATEQPYDGVDQDCSGADLTDVDGDGVAGGPTGADCNDQSSAIKPGATELCDGLDNNCDGVTDLDAVDRLTLHPDGDGDGYGDAQQTVLACEASVSLLVDGQDCQDQDASIHPGSAEQCDGLDNNCNGSIDEGVKTTYYQDADGDGFGNASVTTQACSLPAGFVSNSTDCSDSSAQMYPGLAESCDGLDNNCDGTIDEGVKTTYYQDADGDGHGNPNVSTQACTKPTGYVTSNDDCADNNAALYGVCTSLPPQSGLVGFWKFEESSGTTTSDSSGLANHGKLMSGVTRVSGKAGSGVQTKDGACVTIADSASLSMVGAKALSYMAWIKYASPCNSDRGMILNKEHTYEMGIQCATGDYFQEAIQLSDGSWFWTGGTSVTRNQWAHVTVVWDGSKVTQYLNGVVAGTRNLTGVVSDRATGMGIGCRSVDEAGTTSSSSFFNGVLDEVAVYNRALSASEILSYVNATR
ncbi:MAG: MopE-related protein, partial [Myxococcota bacterium]